MENYKLLETIADISYIAGEMNYFTGNSREDVATFISWAVQFQEENCNTDWSREDYRLFIEKFTIQKLELN